MIRSYALEALNIANLNRVRQLAMSAFAGKAGSYARSEIYRARPTSDIARSVLLREIPSLVSEKSLMACDKRPSDNRSSGCGALLPAGAITMRPSTGRDAVQDF
jgi:hypothetical protein